MSWDLIFEKPPAKQWGGGASVGSSPFGRWIAALREHPGVWAKYKEPCSPTMATNLSRGRAYGVTAGEFEVRTVKADGDYRRWVYARFVGGES